MKVVFLSALCLLLSLTGAAASDGKQRDDLNVQASSLRSVAKYNSL